MTYHILRKITDPGGTIYQTFASFKDEPISTLDAIQVEAKRLSLKDPEAMLYIVQEVGTVLVQPVVTLTTAAPAAAPPLKVYRGAVEPEPEYAGPPRVPEAQPRLLVLSLRQPTEAELAKYLMVVAQGKVIKNTFGALEVPDMPLKPDEYLEVKRAMQGY